MTTISALTREQVERMLGDFKAFHECGDECNHDLNKLSVTDFIQRQTIAQQAQEIERLKDVLVYVADGHLRDKGYRERLVETGSKKP